MYQRGETPSSVDSQIVAEHSGIYQIAIATTDALNLLLELSKPFDPLLIFHPLVFVQISHPDEAPTTQKMLL